MVNYVQRAMIYIIPLLGISTARARGCPQPHSDDCTVTATVAVRQQCNDADDSDDEVDGHDGDDDSAGKDEGDDDAGNDVDVGIICFPTYHCTNGRRQVWGGGRMRRYSRRKRGTCGRRKALIVRCPLLHSGSPPVACIWKRVWLREARCDNETLNAGGVNGM